jgi:hypothetical protein
MANFEAYISDGTQVMPWWFSLQMAPEAAKASAVRGGASTASTAHLKVNLRIDLGKQPAGAEPAGRRIPVLDDCAAWVAL